MYKKLKVTEIIISAIIALMIFVISTYIQNISNKKEPQVDVLIATQDIETYTNLKKEMFETKQISESLAQNSEIIQTTDNIDNNITTIPIYKGQLLYKQNIINKEKINEIKLEEGKEKISIKLKEPQNSLSYQVKKGDKINLYFIGKYQNVFNILATINKYPENVTENEYCVTKILENVEVMGTFDNIGANIKKEAENTIDTIMIAVTNEQSKLIQVLSPNGYFNITGR